MVKTRHGLAPIGAAVIAAVIGLAVPGTGYTQAGSIRCESIDGRQRHCAVSNGGNARLLRQLSDTACVQGRTWGSDARGIWVSGGCRAEFDVGRGGGVASRSQMVRCGPLDNRGRRYCNADTRNGVRLSRQFSRTACVQDRDWGWDDNRIWVTGDCDAEFEIGWRR